MMTPRTDWIALNSQVPCDVPQETVLCLGNFDGVHMGHRALLHAARKLCRERFPHASCGVFCFPEPSTDYLLPVPPRHLCTLPQKMERFFDNGMDVLCLSDFATLRNLSPDEFIDFLCSGCHAVALVCGFNYHFGKNGSGTAEHLSRRLPGRVLTVPEVLWKQETVSSTRIRACIADGNLEDANAMLTLPYSFSAPVLHGKALGRKLGSPTVNQFFPEQMQVPRHGVYVTECVIADGTRYRGVTNVGVRPTVDSDQTLNCETFLLDFSGNLYGQELEVSFLKWLRPEQKFASETLLREQIQKDIRSAAEAVF